MLFKFNDLSLNVEASGISNAKDYIFFIHGFTGNAKDWDDIIPRINKKFACIAIDLIGHGKSDSPEELSYYFSTSISRQISFIISQYTNQPVILAGYSMGGRVALNFAIENPESIRALILESASAGIDDEQLRLERISSDEQLAFFIKNNSIGKFADYWMNIDLFSSQKNLPKKKLKKVRSSKLTNNKTGLANSLLGFGTGKMAPLFGRLKFFTPKTLLITGEFDIKYCDINSGMAEVLPRSRHLTINDAGHNVHLEQPAKFAEAINTFLSEF